MFPFCIILQTILKSLIFVYPNWNYYRHSVSISLIVELPSVLSVRNENQSLDVVLPIFNFCCEIFFMKFTRRFSVFYC